LARRRKRWRGEERRKRCSEVKEGHCGKNVSGRACTATPIIISQESAKFQPFSTQ
jgi:hypothetical protein